MKWTGTVGVRAICVLSVLGTVAAADVLHVPGEYATIQAAIDAAVDGDEVELAPTTYAVSLDFGGKAITLRSEDPADLSSVAGTILEEPGPVPLFYSAVPSSGTIRMDGLTLRYDRGGWVSDTGFELTRCLLEPDGAVLITAERSDVTMTDCRCVEGSLLTGTYISVSDASTVLVERCELARVERGAVVEADHSGIRITDCTFDDVTAPFSVTCEDEYLPGTLPVIVEGSHFTGAVTPPSPFTQESTLGLLVCANAVIRDCTFENFTKLVTKSADGLTLFSTSLVMEDCVFRDNKTNDSAPIVASGDDTDISLARCTFQDNFGGESGGVLVNYGANATITGCRFLDNRSGSAGGAVFVDMEAHAVIDDCDFERNRARVDGAIVVAHASLEVLGSRFVENRATTSTGAIGVNYATARIEDCVFTDNYGDEVAGAIGVYGNHGGTPAEATLIGCRFSGNNAILGAGAYISENATLNATGCQFVGNIAMGLGSNSDEGLGGAIYSTCGVANLVGCSFAGNTAAEIGGAILSDEFASITVESCTFASNEAPVGAAVAVGSFEFEVDTPGLLMVANSTIGPHAGSEPVLDGSGTSLIATHTLTPIIIPGLGNVAGDPAFVRDPSAGGDGWFDDPTTPDLDEAANNDYGDLRLLPGSPAIDAGDTDALPADVFDFDGDSDTSEPLPLDLDGNPRVVDDPATPDTGPVSPAVDLGAYEFQPTACVADLTGDGVLNFDDIDAFVAGFLGDDLGVADCDGSGVLNFDDIDCFVAAFLGGCS